MKDIDLAAARLRYGITEPDDTKARWEALGAILTDWVAEQRGKTPQAKAA